MSWAPSLTPTRPRAGMTVPASDSV